MGMLKLGRSDYRDPPPPCLKGKVKKKARESKLQFCDSLISSTPKAVNGPLLLGASLKVSLQLPPTWLQSCLPPLESQLHCWGAVPVESDIFHA